MWSVHAIGKSSSQKMSFTALRLVEMSEHTFRSGKVRRQSPEIAETMSKGQRKENHLEMVSEIGSKMRDVLESQERVKLLMSQESLTLKIGH